jgi:ribosome maturation factor RimP
MRDESRHVPSRPRRAGMRESGQGASANGERGTSRAAVTADDADKMAGLLQPVIAGAGMDLEAVRISRAGRRRLLRIVVDADGGAGLDEIARVSQKISAFLDSSGSMGDASYTLEVSSPGVDRPLTEPRHWRRAQGRLVTVSLASQQHEGPATARGAVAVRGRVIGASEQGVALDVDGTRRDFAYAELGPGRVEVEFAREDGHAQSGDKGVLDGH